MQDGYYYICTFRKLQRGHPKDTSMKVHEEPNTHSPKAYYISHLANCKSYLATSRDFLTIRLTHA